MKIGETIDFLWYTHLLLYQTIKVPQIGKKFCSLEGTILYILNVNLKLKTNLVDESAFFVSSPAFSCSSDFHKPPQNQYATDFIMEYVA